MVCGGGWYGNHEGKDCTLFAIIPHAWHNVWHIAGTQHFLTESVDPGPALKQYRHSG